MHIDIVSDTICPWCFIGKRRFERALAQAPQDGLTVSWRAFQLNPDMPEGGMDRQEYLALKFGGSVNARQVYAPIVEAGSGEGIPFAFEKLKRTPNTLASHRVIRLAEREGVQDTVVERLFRGYFTEGADIGDPEVLAALAAEAGLPAERVRAQLSGDEDRAEAEAEDRLSRQLGISGVPAFVIDRSLLISGAQDPGIFLRAFAMARERTAAG